jgi:hypothetical protein
LTGFPSTTTDVPGERTRSTSASGLGPERRFTSEVVARVEPPVVAEVGTGGSGTGGASVSMEGTAVGSAVAGAASWSVAEEPA